MQTNAYRTLFERKEWSPSRHTCNSKAPPAAFGNLATPTTMAVVLNLIQFKPSANGSGFSKKGTCHKCNKPGHLQLLNQFPTQSWVTTLPCYQDYWRYWPPTCTTSDPRTTKCSNLPWYTLRETILHLWIFNWDAYSKGQSTHLPYHLWFRPSPHHLQYPKRPCRTLHFNLSSTPLQGTSLHHYDCNLWSKSMGMP